MSNAFGGAGERIGGTVGLEGGQVVMGIIFFSVVAATTIVTSSHDG